MICPNLLSVKDSPRFGPRIVTDTKTVRPDNAGITVELRGARCGFTQGRAFRSVNKAILSRSGCDPSFVGKNRWRPRACIREVELNQVFELMANPRSVHYSRALEDSPELAEIEALHRDDPAPARKPRAHRKLAYGLLGLVLVAVVAVRQGWGLA